MWVETQRKKDKWKETERDKEIDSERETVIQIKIK